MIKKILPLFVLLGFSLGAFGQDKYSMAPESKLAIEGTSTVHSWTVSANKMMGNLTLRNNAMATIDFEVAVADIQSERGATMDKKMHAALKKEEFPSITFAFERLKNTSTLVGMLTIAGTAKSVEIDAEFESDMGVAKLKGEKKILLQDFGMEPPTAMFGQIIVGDAVTVKFDLVFENE